MEKIRLDDPFATYLHSAQELAGRHLESSDVQSDDL